MKTIIDTLRIDNEVEIIKNKFDEITEFRKKRLEQINKLVNSESAFNEFLTTFNGIDSFIGNMYSSSSNINMVAHGSFILTKEYKNLSLLASKMEKYWKDNIQSKFNISASFREYKIKNNKVEFELIIY